MHRGLKTLSLRVARQVDNARVLADALVGAGLPVRYPGLADHPQHDVARRQMSGPGSVLIFECPGDPAELFSRLRLFSSAVSLGGVQSLVTCPARSTHAGLAPKVRAELGITDRLVRMSVGIEDPTDLVEDLHTALDGTGRPAGLAPRRRGRATT
nr:PLP-dependent transferase [Nocardiopsis sp. CNR-923]